MISKIRTENSQLLTSQNDESIKKSFKSIVYSAFNVPVPFPNRFSYFSDHFPFVIIKIFKIKFQIIKAFKLVDFPINGYFRLFS